MSYAIVFLVALLQNPAVPLTRPATITGLVVKQETGEPLAKATVILTAETARGPKPMTVSTSAEGKFTFENVVPDRYKIAVTRNGYARAEYGDRGGNGCGSGFAVIAGQHLENLRIGMMSAGVISGRLLDRDGEPASNLTVQALRYAYQNGRRILDVVQTTQTNDLGEYRLFWLAPGRYYVAAGMENSGLNPFLGPIRILEPVPAPPGAPTLPPGSIFVNPASAPGVGAPRPRLFEPGALADMADLSPPDRYAPLYFPGTPDPRAASPIELRAGDVFLGANMTVTIVHAHHIKGTIVSPRTGETPRSAVVTLVPQLSGPAANSTSRNAVTTPDGHFEVTSALPGSYFLTATGSDSSGRLYGRIPVEVGETDLENISISLSRGTDVSGRISIDDPEALARINGASLRSLADPTAAAGLLNSNLSADVRNGAFKIEGVPPGDYIAGFTFLAPGNVYMKSLRLGSQDVRNGFRLDGQPAVQLEAVLGTMGGAVDGVVLNDQKQTVPGATVVLVPEPYLRQRSTLYRIGTTDPSGRFHLEAIAAGEYKLFAWEAVERGAWEDADFLRPVEASGKAVTLREGTTETVQLLVIRSAAPLYGQCDVGSR